VAVLGDSLAAGDDGDGLTATADRWWFRAGVAIGSARRDRDVVVRNFGLRGSGIEHVETTVASLDVRDYQVAIIMEGRNDYQSEADWSPRLGKIIQGLERQGLVVVLATMPPILSKGELLGFSRNSCIRAIAGTARPVLDFDARWVAAGPALASAWYADAIHASVAGQVIEADMTTTLLLTLIK
jgi:hypothetical protein